MHMGTICFYRRIDDAVKATYLVLRIYLRFHCVVVFVSISFYFSFFLRSEGERNLVYYILRAHLHCVHAYKVIH